MLIVHMFQSIHSSRLADEVIYKHQCKQKAVKGSCSLLYNGAAIIAAPLRSKSIKVKH